MAQWLRGSDGRLRWAPGEPAPAEAQANDARVREMIAARQAPAPKLWAPESTVTAAGRPFESRREWESFKEKRGLTEERGATVKRVRPTSAEMFKAAVADAEVFLRESGQYVAPGTPTTEATKAKIARGESVLERMPEPVAPAPSPVDPPGRAYSSRHPWGYTGDKGDILALGKENAIARAEGRPSSLSREE